MPALGGFPSEYCYAVWKGKTRMKVYPSMKNVDMFISFERDRHTDTQTPHDGIGSAYA